MQQLQQERSEINKQLNKALQLAKDRGKAYAKAEQAYRCRQRQEILEERANGMPVTIISDVVKGHEEVSKLRLERDIAKTLYETAREAINVKKIQLRMVEDDIAAVRRGV